MIQDSLLIRQLVSGESVSKGKGLLFGRYISDPSLRVDSPSDRMWMVYPSQVPVEIGAASEHFGGDTRTWEDALPDLVQGRDSYYIRAIEGDLPETPFIIAQSKFIDAGMCKILIRLHARNIADLAEYGAMCEVNEWVRRRFEEEEFLPGVDLRVREVPSIISVRTKPLASGMYLVVEPEVMRLDQTPMVLRLGEVADDGIVEAVLFWVDEKPSLQPGDSLYRRLLPMPRYNGSYREKLIASVVES